MTTAPGKYRVTALAGLNLRDMPGLGSHVLGKVNDGAEVEVTAIADAGGMKWAYVAGWVAADYLRPLESEFVLVPDVSQYQGRIDWHKMRMKGINQVMIRGPIGLPDGDYDRDRRFDINWRDAAAEGMGRGIYCVWLPGSDGQAQGAYHRQFCQDAGPDLRSAGDFELGGNFGRGGARGSIEAYLSAFGAYQAAFVYAGLWWWNYYVGASSIPERNPLWVSHPEPEGVVLTPEQCTRPLPGGWVVWDGYQFSWTFPGEEWGTSSDHLDMSWFRRAVLVL